MDLFDHLSGNPIIPGQCINYLTVAQWGRWPRPWPVNATFSSAIAGHHPPRAPTVKIPDKNATVYHELLM